MMDRRRPTDSGRANPARRRSAPPPRERDMRRQPPSYARQPRRLEGRYPEVRRPRKVRRGPASDARLHGEIERARLAATQRGSRGMSFAASIVSALFFGFIVVYLAWSAHGFFQQPVATEIVRMGNIEVDHTIPGIIIRHEQVFFAERDGRVALAVQDSDRVRDGMHVASIVDPDAAIQNEQSLADFEADMISISGRRHATHAGAHVERMNTNMRNMVDNNIHNFAHANLSDIYALKDRLQDLTSRRNQAIVNETRMARTGLDRDHDSFLRQRDGTTHEMIAEATGIASFYLDGQEEVITPGNMRNLFREQVHHASDHASMSASAYVEAGDPVFRIVGNAWYVAAFMPNELIEDWAEGDDRVMYLENAMTGRFEPLTMRIHVLNYHHRESFLIFRSTRNVAEFINQRAVNILTRSNVQSGFTIPTSAIATRRFFRIPLTHIHGEEGGERHVMHNRGEAPIRVPVTIAEESETHAYILEETFELSIGSLIGARDLDNESLRLTTDDVFVVRGIYRATMNVAEFFRVELEAEMPDTDGHVFLDPEREQNRWLRQFDTIVTHAINVHHGMILE